MVIFSLSKWHLPTGTHTIDNRHTPKTLQTKFGPKKTLPFGNFLVAILGHFRTLNKFHL